MTSRLRLSVLSARMDQREEYPDACHRRDIVAASTAFCKMLSAIILARTALMPPDKTVTKALGPSPFAAADVLAGSPSQFLMRAKTSLIKDNHENNV